MWIELAEILRLVGAGGLPVGRLYEGHINALSLVQRYGQTRQIERMAEEHERANYSGCGTLTTARVCILGEKKAACACAGEKFLPLARGEFSGLL